MTYETLRHVTYALVLSWVDYCNSLCDNAPVTSTKRLQSLINMSARVMFGRSRFDHITDFTRDYLHWLSIRHRVDFKICSMVYTAQHDLSPIYITEMMKPTSMIPRRQDLRSVSRCDLIIPKHRTKFAGHAFIVAGQMEYASTDNPWSVIAYNISWFIENIFVRDCLLRLLTIYCDLQSSLFRLLYKYIV